MNLITSKKTDTGIERDNNEDSVAIFNYSATSENDPVEICVMILADGMGGMEKGEKASRMAIELLSEKLPYATLLELVEAGVEKLISAVEEAIKKTGREIYNFTSNRDEYKGMGTTVVLAIYLDPTTVISHIGDSRAYLFSGTELEQKTEDHSVVAQLLSEGSITEEQAEAHPFRSVITQYLGKEDEINPDTVVFDLNKGDVLLLASDGLTDMVEDEKISLILSNARGPTEACERLVVRANEKGGQDNISVITASRGPVRKKRR